jgi:4-amino-4-deoxy-L-arabinose transferase-like glycosyltransferase
VIKVSQQPRATPAAAPRARPRLGFSWSEIGAACGLLVAGVCLRIVAANHLGTLVDEPVYQAVGAFTWHHGYPALRPPAGQALTPFLYQPPFFFYLLGGWFALLHSSSLIVARYLSVVVSGVVLVLVYAVSRSLMGRAAALLTLFLVALDPWVILTNAAVYLENSQLVLILVAVWAYWRATRADASMRRGYVLRYLVAGLALGAVIVYKQIGGYLVLAVLINLLLTRGRHWQGHAYLLGTAAAMLAAYLGTMHAVFGTVFDQETYTQLLRTLGLRYSPGLDYDLPTLVKAILETYWVFVMTIATMLVGAVVAVISLVQHLRRRRGGETVVLSWALAALVFAPVIALKSPHYFVLWLIPFYLLIAGEAVAVVARIRARAGRRPRLGRLAVAGGLAVVLLANLWSFQARFLSGAGDALRSAVSYVNQEVPAADIVAAENYVGVQISSPYVSMRTTPDGLLAGRASFVVLYWSLTEPIPSSLGDLSSYCVQAHTFNGFNDHAEVCRLSPARLAQTPPGTTALPGPDPVPLTAGSVALLLFLLILLRNRRRRLARQG